MRTVNAAVDCSLGWGAAGVPFNSPVLYGPQLAVADTCWCHVHW